MNVTTMRRADRLLGVPACGVLTFARYVFSLFAAAPTSPPKRILFVKLAEQGSTVLAAPAIRRAIEMVGKENVYFLVFEPNRFILDAMDMIPHDNVITITTGDMATTVLGGMRCVRKLRSLKIDTAIDLEFFARSSAAMTFLSGATRRIGFHSRHGEAAWRGNLMTHRLNFNAELHTAQSFHMMVQAIEADARALPTFNFDPVSLDDVLPQITFTDDEKKRVNTILCRETGLASPPRIVLLNANCSDLMPLRRWPTDRYIQLARQLTDTFSDVWIGFTGAPEDESAINELLHGKDLPRCINLAGKTSLRELLVLYGFCELLITNDSGPAHFAAMTPIDVITLFGPETPRLFAAPSPRNHVLWAGIACSPCVNAFNDRQTSCRDNVCMQRITLDQVFDLACEIYRRRVGS